MGRTREAIAGPGIDTRAWAAMARVDNSADAIRRDAELGWLVDCTVQGGPYSGEELTCRVSQALAGDGSGESIPLTPDCEVAVLLIQGGTAVPGIIVGQVHNADGCPAPATVNALQITEELAQTTEITASPYAVEAQYAGDRRVSAPNQTIETDPTGLLSLAQFAATQPYVRGTDLAAALSTLAVALTAYSVALGPPGATPSDPVTIGAAQSAASALQTALAQFQTQVTASLSTRIVGE